MKSVVINLRGLFSVSYSNNHFHFPCYRNTHMSNLFFLQHMVHTDCSFSYSDTNFHSTSWPSLLGRQNQHGMRSLIIVLQLQLSLVLLLLRIYITNNTAITTTADLRTVVLHYCFDIYYQHVITTTNLNTYTTVTYCYDY